MGVLVVVGHGNMSGTSRLACSARRHMGLAAWILLSALGVAHAFVCNPAVHQISNLNTLQRRGSVTTSGQRLSAPRLPDCFRLSCNLNHPEGSNEAPRAPVILKSEHVEGDRLSHMTGIEEFDRAWRTAWVRKENIRCPFWRRRAVDFLETSMSVARFIAARHKSLDPFPPVTTGDKLTMLSVEEVMEIVRRDFVERKYYVTGKLSKEIYADDCFFDAPDPDMPVTGLSKYVDAISNLFVRSSSNIELLGLEAVGADKIIARWRLQGTLKLPWRPSVKAYTGTTLYQLDKQRLIFAHTEVWSITAVDAFVSAVFPNWPGAAPAAPPAADLLALPERERTPDPSPLLPGLKPRSAPARPSWMPPPV